MKQKDYSLLAIVICLGIVQAIIPVIVLVFNLPLIIVALPSIANISVVIVYILAELLRDFFTGFAKKNFKETHQCPNCEAIWTADEVTNQSCNHCGYPANNDIDELVNASERPAVASIF